MERRQLDVGRFNDERFVVMAGAGFDAEMLKQSGGLKSKVGRAGYVWSGIRNVRTKPFHATVKVDGDELLVMREEDLFAVVEK